MTTLAQFSALATVLAGCTALEAGPSRSAPQTATGQLPAAARPPQPAPSLRVTYYDLHVRLDPARRLITGHAAIWGRRGAGSADTLTLDLAPSMVVDSALLRGHRIPVRRDTATVRLPAPASSRETESLDVVIFYHGTPAGNALVFGHHGSGTVISSYGLPYSARQWWPCPDAPAYKADSADIEITAPSELTAASNGRLMGRTANADGTASTRWAVRYPIYPDVIAIAVSDYRTLSLTYRDAGGGNVPLTFFVFAEDSDKASHDFSVLPAMLAHHSRRFGPYPFAKEKYGIAEMAQQSFREHQTLPGYGSHLITGDHTNDWILAHELAHQWFGDALTVRNWSHVWLNEGFATYAALLWLEDSKGVTRYRSEARKWMTPDAYRGVLFVPDTTDVEHMFTDVTFKKGALVLHMLRHVMGDPSFFRALQRYVAHHLHGTVTTDDFQRAAEQEYGRSLAWFFREWVYGAGAPRYDAPTWTLTHADGTYRAALTIRQLQDSTLFRMPLDVDLTTPRGVKRLVVWDTARVQQVQLSLPDSVTAIQLDPDGWVVMRARP